MTVDWAPYIWMMVHSVYLHTPNHSRFYCSMLQEESLITLGRLVTSLIIMSSLGTSVMAVGRLVELNTMGKLVISLVILHKGFTHK